MVRTSVLFTVSSALNIYAIYLCALLNSKDVYSNTGLELLDVVQALAPKEVEVALVSFNPRPSRLHNERSQMLPIKKTTWLFYDRKFRSFLTRNAKHRKMTVAIVTELHNRLELLQALILSDDVYYSGVHWILVRDISEMKQEIYKYHKMFPAIMLSVLGISGNAVTNALIYSSSRRRRVFVGAQELPKMISSSELPWRKKQQRFSGNVLRLGCVYLSRYENRNTFTLNPSFCHTSLNTLFLRLLAHKNLSLTYRRFYGYERTLSALFERKIDLVVMKTNLESVFNTLLSYADVDIAYNTFYARANDTRVISVFGVLSYSTVGVSLTVTCMVVCAVVLASLSGNQRFRNLAVNFAREAMFLLAALLATSLPESQSQTNGRIRRLLYFIWFMSILSLSVYIRGEITALVTVTGPADHLDTLEELESALDRRTVSPCVVEGTSTKGILAHSNQKSSSSLLRKLNAAYWRESGDSPVVQTPLECLFRAGRADHVCFLPHQHECLVEHVARGVRQFEEPFTMVLDGFPVRHGYSLLPALRKFFFAVREAALWSSIVNFCNYDAGALIEVRIELQQFIMHYFALQLVSLFVFAVECLVHFAFVNYSAGWFHRLRLRNAT
ncbi:hypothetical protein MTO96_051686 [Rhipicephalus appendiculatus]